MVETIEIGGNSVESLEILSEYSEKERELQVNRRELLKPYILLAFIWSALIAVTTTIVALTTGMMTVSCQQQHGICRMPWQWEINSAYSRLE